MNSPLIQSLINRIQDRFSQAKQTAQNAEEVVQELPEVTRTQLLQRLNQLPPPKPHLEAVKQRCVEAIAHWQSSLEAENSLVILTEPVLPLYDILADALLPLESETCHIQQPLASYRRPIDPEKIPSSLRAVLESVEVAIPHAETHTPAMPEELENRRQVIVIPALEQCFLRCIGGWKSVEELQKQVVQYPSCFWIIGCSSWSWAFLERVCQISAYLEQVFPLPKLAAEELRDWLEPLVKEAIFIGDLIGDLQNDTSSQELSAAEAEAGDRRSYWSALASLSEGRSAIAAQLWLHSLGIQAVNLPEEDTTSLAPEDLSLTLRKPVLPPLPPLSPTDRYLLQSLLIHSSLSEAHLTLSLGESDTQVRSRLQILQRAGVVLQKQDHMTLNPAHLPRLEAIYKVGFSDPRGGE